jgi:hypothetical protein
MVDLQRSKTGIRRVPIHKSTRSESSEEMAYIFSRGFDFDVVFPADHFLNLTDGSALLEKAQDLGANRIESKHLAGLDIKNNGAVRSIDTAQLL